LGTGGSFPGGKEGHTDSPSSNAVVVVPYVIMA